MTEEEKMQWLKSLVESGANVAQVNLGDGYQTFNMGKDGNWQQEPASEAEVEDALIRFVFDDEEREKVIKGLQACEDTGQVASLARKIWMEEIVEYEVVRSVEFHRAIIPLLRFDTSETALKQAIAKQVRE